MIKAQINFEYKEFYQFSFNLRPQALQRARSGRHGFYTPKESVAFKRELLRQLEGQPMGELLVGPLLVECVFRFVKPKSVKRIHHIVKPDCSNLIKGVEDAFNKIIWKDDAIITSLMVFKRYAETDGVDLFVYSLD